MENRRIGTIYSVRGIHILAKLDKMLPPTLINNGKIEPAPKINSYVKTRVGLIDVICVITGENYESFDNKIDGHKSINGYILNMDVIGIIDNNKFYQGIRILPIALADVFLLDDSDRNIIFSLDENKSLVLGLNIYDTSKRAGMEINKLIPSHIGIFGNTGSGKSNTLVKILREYNEKILSKINGGICKVLLFDLNNEYGENAIVDKENKKIYSINTRKQEDQISDDNKIPLDYSSLNEDDFVVFLNATQKTQAPVIKKVFDKVNKGFAIEEYRNELFTILQSSQINIFNSIKYQLREQVSGLDQFFIYRKDNTIMANGWNGPETNEFKRIFDTNVVIEEPKKFMDKFLFALIFQVAKDYQSGNNSDFVMPLISRTEKLKNNFDKIFIDEKKDLFCNKNIAIIQLGNCNSDMTDIIPAIISKILLDKAIEEKGDNELPNKIINIVIDEAHNLLFSNIEDTAIHNSTLEVFEKIVKEGRKFGVFLMVSSQRPSDISSGIISQLHNYFIHKLVNPSDLQKIRKSVAYLDESALDFLTVLSPGECIISGTAVQIPQFVKIDIEKEHSPLSGTIEIIGKKGIASSFIKE